MTGLQMVSAKLHAWTDACLQAEHCVFLCPGVVLQTFCVCVCVSNVHAAYKPNAWILLFCLC